VWAGGPRRGPRALSLPRPATLPDSVSRPLLLALEEELDDVGNDLPRALVELGLGQVGDWMRQSEELVVWQAPALGHGVAGGLEDVGHDGHGGDARLLQEGSVGPTAPRAGPPVAPARGDARHTPLR